MSKITNIRLPGLANPEYSPTQLNEILQGVNQIVRQLNSSYTPQATENNQSELDWFSGFGGTVELSTLDNVKHEDRLLAYTTATHSAASANTAYAITWENEALGKHIYVDDTNTNRIYFEHAGVYKIDFSCELQSQNVLFKTIYIFPAINGTDVAYSTIVQSLRNANDSFTVTRSGLFQVEAGDYLEAKFAVDNTNLWIEGSAATAFSPAAPSAVIIITKV